MKACRFALLAIALFIPIFAFAGLELPSSVTAEATGPTGAMVSFDARATGSSEDDRGRSQITVTCSPASLSTFPLGTTTVTCNASDGSHGSFPVTVVDTTGPVLKLPPALDFVAPPPPPPPPPPQPPPPRGLFVNYLKSATDLVDGLVAVNCQPPSGAFFLIGTTTVNCTAHDSRGNTSTGTFTVTVYDHPPAPGEGPRDLTVEATGPFGARVVYDTSDPDGEGGRPASSDCAPAPGSTFPLGNTEVTCAIGGRFWVVVEDTTPPSIELQGTLSTTTSDPNGAVLFFSAIGTDLVDGPVGVSCTPGSGDLYPPGTTTITCNASDAHGNSVEQTFEAEVIVLNTDPPVISVPADISVEATNAAGATVTYDATATDDVDGSVPVTCTPASGSVFGIGTTTVNCSASDSSGSTTNASFLVTVSDTTPPTLTLPAALSAEATGPGGANVSFSVSASDIVDGAVAVECTHLSGQLFPLGTTIVTCHATDAHANGVAGTFSVSVVDTTPPDVTVPADITEEATSFAGAVATFSASANDLVDGALSATCSPLSGTTFPLGTTTVTCSATDSHGNTGSASFDVNIVDTTPPEIESLTVSPNELWSPNKRMATVTVTAQVSDIADPAPLVRIYDVTANEPITAGDWSLTDALTASLRVDRLGGGGGRVYTLYVEAIDASGNRATGTVTVTVPHDQRGGRTR
jgi:hypothetical protein